VLGAPGAKGSHTAANTRHRKAGFRPRAGPRPPWRYRIPSDADLVADKGPRLRPAFRGKKGPRKGAGRPRSVLGPAGSTAPLLLLSTLNIAGRGLPDFWLCTKGIIMPVKRAGWLTDRWRIFGTPQKRKNFGNSKRNSMPSVSWRGLDGGQDFRGDLVARMVSAA